jgi:nitroreductase/dihydropteridine reductase
MDLQAISKTGHFTKAFKENVEIPQAEVNKLMDFLRSSASSVNAQPWHFVVAAKQESKNRIADTLNPFNGPKVRNASICIIFCTMMDMPAGHLEKVHEKEKADGRFATDAIAAGWHEIQTSFIRFRRYDLKDLTSWMEKQTYLAAGAFAMAAAGLGIDVCMMEGFEAKLIDAAFGLREKSLGSTLLVSLGYRDEEKDFAFNLPKSRLPVEDLFTFL